MSDLLRATRHLTSLVNWTEHDDIQETIDRGDPLSSIRQRPSCHSIIELLGQLSKKDVNIQFRGAEVPKHNPQGSS